MSQPRLLGGRYALEDVIGRGGMAEVYRARDQRLDRLVAIKSLRTDLARDHTFQARFRREAQSAASLNHPSIIAVYDTGEDLVDGVGIPYIVMEYVDGRTLKELLDDDRRLLPERTAEITDGILRALEYSHRNGIVHRDIKPANVMLTPQAEVKVMDFGIARTTDDSQATMTQTSQVIGTAQYLSPEQARGERVDARSDIYSTGCVLYELLTGGPPFTGDSPVSIAYQHVREDPVPPSQLDPEIPSWLEAVALRSMTKDREQRYQSAEEMREDIQRGLQGMPTAAATTTLPAANDRPEPYDEYDEDERREGSGGKAALWVLLALAVLAALIFAGWLLMSGGPETTTVPDVEGMSQEEAESELNSAGFSDGDITVEEQNDDEVPEGDAIETDPSAEREVSTDSEITLFVSTGPGSVDVPDVSGMTRDDATAELQDAGFQIGSTSQETSEDVEEGRVTRTDPEAGSQADPETTVDMWVSEGAETVQVPDLSGMTQEEAESALEDADLDGSFESQQSEEPAGTVIGQDPGANSEVEPGSTVNVTLAEEQASTPPEDDDEESPPGDGETPDDWPTDIPWPPGSEGDDQEPEERRGSLVTG
ncbi:serine/threonine-protein kinase [Lipingzhangella halophila]|uniref:non-specific serine/threonine protein kinase n=1 Tax=Lipingzhangella halophila TaxID=1783352 RepID=A0A7W7RP31_9ACTN|nr:Stk1 family PASTA domain-containing Ser/Thr kinase [Lipingzhangella halophila]MBB4935554.1 serine/threonine-protein kinase [Lipingzhangella halophila]